MNGTLVGTIVVPVGKVLKLESVSVYLTSSTGDLQWYVKDGSSYYTSLGCWIGDHLVWAPYWGGAGDKIFTKMVDTANFPVWYGPGTHEIRVRYKTTFGAGTWYAVSYSAIEFNVI